MAGALDRLVRLPARTLLAVVELLQNGYYSTTTPLRNFQYSLFGNANFTANAHRQATAAFQPRAFEKDLRGRVAMVTGCQTPLGIHVAEELARRGAVVHMVCPDQQTGEAAHQQVVSATSTQTAQLQICDIATLGAVRQLASTFEAANTPLHLLVVAGGITGLGWSKDGYDINFAANLLVPWALVRLLQPALERAEPAGRVVLTAPAAALLERVDARNLEHDDMMTMETNTYSAMRAMAQDGRKLLAVAEQLAQELAPSGVGVFTATPGWHEASVSPSCLPSRTYQRLESQEKLKGVEASADTLVWLALQDAQDLVPGAWYANRTQIRKHLPLGGTQHRQRDVDAMARQLTAILAAHLATHSWQSLWLVAFCALHCHMLAPSVWRPVSMAARVGLQRRAGGVDLRPARPQLPGVPSRPSQLTGP